jgi:hypothetical protein
LNDHTSSIDPQQSQQVGRQRRKLRLGRIALRMYDNVPSCRYLQTMAAHDFPHAPRLCGSWFARRKTVKWEFERRFPARYTASNSPRRTSRASRGKSRRSALFGSEPMTALLATRRKHLAASCGLHARTETVRLGAPALARLISALWQSNPPFGYARRPCEVSNAKHRMLRHTPPGPSSGSQAASAALCESISVVDPRAHGQESGDSRDYALSRTVLSPL